MAKKKEEARYIYKECPASLNPEVYYLIKRRRLQMIVHSYLYYRMNTNIISDHQFDAWARELRDLQKEHPEESKACDLHKDFADWDGSTGYHLVKFVWAEDICRRLVKGGS